METKIYRANVFVVDVTSGIGGVIAELGDQFSDLDSALNCANSIDKSEITDSRDAQNASVTITAGLQPELEVAADGCTGKGMIIYERYL